MLISEFQDRLRSRIRSALCTVPESLHAHFLTDMFVNSVTSLVVKMPESVIDQMEFDMQAEEQFLSAFQFDMMPRGAHAAAQKVVRDGTLPVELENTLKQATRIYGKQEVIN